MSVQMNSESGGGLETSGDMEEVNIFIKQGKYLPTCTQVVKSLVVLMVILEVFPIVGWIVLSAIGLHLLLAGLSGQVVDKVGKSIETIKRSRLSLTFSLEGDAGVGGGDGLAVCLPPPQVADQAPPLPLRVLLDHCHRRRRLPSLPGLHSPPRQCERG